MVDVKGRRCETVNCVKQVAYGLEGKKTKFCMHHRRQGIADTKPRSYSARSFTSSGATSSAGTLTPCGSGGGGSSGEIVQSDPSPFRFSNFRLNSPIATDGKVDPERGAKNNVTSSFAAKWGKRSQTNPRETPNRSGTGLDLLRPAKKHVWFPSSQRNYSAPGEVGLPDSAATMRARTLGVQKFGRAAQSAPTMTDLLINLGADAPLSHWLFTASTEGVSTSRGAGDGDNGGGADLAEANSSFQWTSCGVSDISPGMAESTISASSCYGNPFDLSVSQLPPLMIRSCSSLPSTAFSGGSSASGSGSGSGCSGDVSTLSVAGSRFAGGRNGGGGGRFDGGERNTMSRDMGGGGGLGWGSASDSWRRRSSPSISGDALQSQAGILTGLDPYSQNLFTLGGVDDMVAGVSQSCDSLNNSGSSIHPQEVGNTNRVGDESTARSKSSWLKTGPTESGQQLMDMEDENWIRELIQGSMETSATVEYPPPSVGLQNTLVVPTTRGASLAQQHLSTLDRYFDQEVGTASTPDASSSFSQQQQQQQTPETLRQIQQQQPRQGHETEVVQQASPQRKDEHANKTARGGGVGGRLAVGGGIAPASTVLREDQQQLGHCAQDGVLSSLRDCAGYANAADGGSNDRIFPHFSRGAMMTTASMAGSSCNTATPPLTSASAAAASSTTTSKHGSRNNTPSPASTATLCGGMSSSSPGEGSTLASLSMAGHDQSLGLCMNEGLSMGAGRASPTGSFNPESAESCSSEGDQSMTSLLINLAAGGHGPYGVQGSGMDVQAYYPNASLDEGRDSSNMVSSGGGLAI